jgi:uncharacterized protein YjbI with pentapeptide repeats
MSEKEILISKLRNHDHNESIRAVNELRKRGWLTDGSLRGVEIGDFDPNNSCPCTDLRGVNLSDANLQGATIVGAVLLQEVNLSKANLQDIKFSTLLGVSLEGANFAGANLQNANFNCAIPAPLERANFASANLQNVDFGLANLRGANLSNANLQGAELVKLHGGANLESANLSGANLKGAKLVIHYQSMSALNQSAKFNEETILPDGTKWTSKADLERFTNPAHPNYYSIS